MNTLPTWQLYDGAAETYERSRSGYPQAVLDGLKARLGSSTMDGIALDTGAGTGIFSRLLLKTLPELAEILCVEPNEDMVRVGSKACRGLAKIRYVRGFAEALPAADSSLVLVTAATAANWFDRPTFFQEVSRVLKPGGLIALLHYKHRYWANPLAADFAEFQERCIPGYQRDTYSDFKGGYGRADFELELREEPSFEAVTKLAIPWEQRATPNEFSGYCYSMSHIKKAESQIGASGVRDEIDGLISRHTGPDGRLIVGWTTELTMARARAEGQNHSAKTKERIS
jgi:ubiquinone/menaquinone biosynthesis C-methylase UbiE